MSQVNTVLTTDRITAPMMAGKSPTMSKPATTVDTVFSIRPLMTKVNKPKVNTFNGKVRINNTGRMTALMMPKMMAAMNMLLTS